MFTLANRELTVSILDPVADVERLGSRYCVGGYIYQVTDAEKGELLSGPQYPSPTPDTFDGQGAPDQFVTVLGGDAPVGSEVTAIGVGRVLRTSDKEPFQVRFNPQVSHFLPWSVSQTENSITMQTEDAVYDWAYQLTRTVTLEGRTVHSHTAISNTGQAPLPIRWFAHPFFPLTEDRVYCQFSLPVTFPENPAYEFNDEEFICQKAEYDWERGYFLALDHNKVGSNMTFIQRHPTLGQMTIVTSFVPDWLPIWSNARTFSVEPYYIRELAPGESDAWSIDYQF
jgi:hypothetical protein